MQCPRSRVGRLRAAGEAPSQTSRGAVAALRGARSRRDAADRSALRQHCGMTTLALYSTSTNTIVYFVGYFLELCSF